MNEFEKNIEELYSLPPFRSGGGIFRSPWDIEWADEPYEEMELKSLPASRIPKEISRVLTETAPEEEAAVYIHIPFCRLSCTYCAFFKRKVEPEAQAVYVKQLIEEMKILGETHRVRTSRIKAVFFGGGTPGVLSADEISRLLSAVRHAFPLLPEAEVTMESSLSDMTEEKMDAAIEGGVNRFSFGVQSFNTKVRNAVGRVDSREKAMEIFSRFSRKKADMILDLIYGLPYETEETMRQDIRDAKSCGAAGLDLYKLQLLAASPLGKAFAASGRTLDRETLQGLYRSAVEELDSFGAETISCSHWRFRNSERSLYNTFSAAGRDTYAVGMACGGRLGNLGLMKPMSEEMYGVGLSSGMYCPMGIKVSGPHRKFLAKLHGVCDLGVISPKILEGETGYPLVSLLTPILTQWKMWGLIDQKERVYKYTSAGRYWYRTMARVILRIAEYMLYGRRSLERNKSGWGSMMNMR